MDAEPDITGNDLPDPGVPTKLWLCIVLPELALEALQDEGDHCDYRAVAVIEQQESVATVHSSNAVAREAGIRRGMKLTAALALLPDLYVCKRNQAAETKRLHRLAQWALGYTPVVCINSTGALFLEVGGSLRLFNGLKNLRACLHRDLENSGCRGLLASAPTAKAAFWLARSGQETSCHSHIETRRQLARLPLDVLDWPDNIRLRLQRMGVGSIQDCLRLPRDGFARRIGPVYLRELDQALGQHPELLRYYQSPIVFQDRLGFATEIFAAEGLMQATHRLLEGLGRFLQRRQLSAERVCLHVEHYRQPATIIELVLSQPVHTVDYLGELLRLRLDKQSLSEPAIGISLSVAVVPMCRLPETDLLASAGNHSAVGDLITQLVERLRARLGRASVHGLGLLADHRPEHAWEAVDVADDAVSQDLPGQMFSRKRPLWLLRQPRRLEVRDDKPVYRGQLSFVGDAERIETGWWDSNSVRRDYYVVAGRQGNRWWVYREHHRWYLHGIFG
jgi:protein ImuB